MPLPFRRMFIPCVLFWPLFITGATAGGIGAETVIRPRHCPRPPSHHLPLLARGESSTLPVIKAVNSTSPTTCTHFILVHLDEVFSIRKGVAEVEEQLGKEGKTDFMINNAAIIGGDGMKGTKNGWGLGT